MLEKSFGLLFYLNKPKNFQKRNMPIYLRITVDDVSNEISTGREWDLLKWNVHAQRAAGTKEESKALNTYLATLQAKVYEAKRQLLENKQTITAELLRKVLKGRTERAKMLVEVFQYHNVQMKSWWEQHTHRPR